MIRRSTRATARWSIGHSLFDRSPGWSPSSTRWPTLSPQPCPTTRWSTSWKRSPSRFPSGRSCGFSDSMTSTVTIFGAGRIHRTPRSAASSPLIDGSRQSEMSLSTSRSSAASLTTAASIRATTCSAPWFRQSPARHRSRMPSWCGSSASSSSRAMRRRSGHSPTSS